jgi:YggT family protein
MFGMLPFRELHIPLREVCKFQEEYMTLVRLLSFIINIYMFLIFIRIILTWFSWMRGGGVQEFLAGITDPYLNWFRRFTFLRIGFLDLSPVAALGVLSLVNRVLITLAQHGRITLGIILALILQAAWGAISFILGFVIIILVLRLIAYLFRLDVSGAFWRIIDTISQPILYRINRIIFRGRIANYLTSLIISIASLILISLGLRILVFIVTGMLVTLPF